MGTRSLTRIKDGKKELTVMYRQFDGYLDGHGKELAEWLVNATIVNGIGMDETRTIFNGMGCLAASMFKHFKEDAGGIYCYPAGSKDCWEEYNYTISESPKGKIKIKVTTDNRKDVLFEGTPSELLQKINKESNES